MKNMMIFTPLCLTLCWMLSVDSMRVFPLNMAEDSVDDMYDGCSDTASMDWIKNKYSKELTSGEEYAWAWKKAETCADDRFKKRSPEDMALTKDHMQAICVYTARYIYSEFNAAVRKQRENYPESFQYHILHSLLTTAIRILNPNNDCHITYRRNNVAFTGTLNQKIRFGSFASSSYKTNLIIFGNETCFQIKTCYGGYLKDYSFLNKREQEVLIPPYEKFTIKDIKRSREIEGLEDCKIVYVLESAGTESNLNCKLFNPHPLARICWQAKKISRARPTRKRSRGRPRIRKDSSWLARICRRISPDWLVAEERAVWVSQLRHLPPRPDSG
ncbi:ecto-ADP-ribosyltransferase 4-like isoform X2 [Melanotaenia boesemani]|uniref:ecto-ADP-ribosyltransferase 4-like isoform X2 n=1 Tax=Melanotaenia boesemani TaxID=1250792 RepID=UPI001C043B93|nr:ecto-ADP-ribosyltransferase 4-like isoform X2 [Melanotaenia boesemani]